MSAEDILYEAEKHGKRQKLLYEVSILRAKQPRIPLNDLYTICWEEIKAADRT